MREVELHLAFMWTCDDCGRDNFCRSVSIPLSDMSPGDIEQACEFIGCEPGDLPDGNLQTRPTRVKCPHCAAEFDTTEPGEEVPT